MNDPATKRFTKDYMALNQSLRIPHPYFQQIEYVKVNSMIIKEVLKHRHQRILDVGSGAGHLIHGLSAVSRGCVALDIETDRLILLRKKNPDIRGIAANGEKGLPFKANVFDVIIASEVLEHLNHPEKFFEEVTRVLKEDGILIITTPNSDNLTYRILRAMPKGIAHSIAQSYGLDLKLHPGLLGGRRVDSSDPHVHKVEGYSKKELLELGKLYGLRTNYLRSFGLPMPDKAYSRLPKPLTRFIVTYIEDHIPFALRHLIVYKNK